MPRFPRVSDFSHDLSDKVFGHLVRKAALRTGPIFPLHVGDTWREPIAAARAEAQRTVDHPRLHNYSPVQGEPALLDAIGDHMQTRFGEVVERDCLQVTAGATSGISVVCQTLLDPCDEVILPSPYWPLIRGIFASRGARVVEVPFFDRVQDAHFDVEAVLEAAITPKTSAIYVNSPHNPTGALLASAQADAVARVANRHDLWVIADEVYEELWLTGNAPEPLWKHPGLRERVIACHSLSKSYGLAGARIGYIHGPRDAMTLIRGVHTFQSYCAPRPMQFAAVAALREGVKWLEESRALYREAAQTAATMLGLAVPDAGTFLFFDAGPYLDDEATDCLPFLEECLEVGVLLTPGASCGKDYKRWARLCFTSVPPSDLVAALERLEPLVTR